MMFGKQSEPFMDPQKRWWKKAGYDQPLLHYTLVFGRSNLIVLDKEIVQYILTSPYGKKDCRFAKAMDIAKTMVEYGLVTLEGEDWMRHRQIIQPAFNTSFIRESLSASAPRRVQKLITYWTQAAGREIDVSSHLSALTLDIIGDVGFGHEFEGLESVKRWAENKDGMQEGLAELKDPFIRALIEVFKFDPLSMFFFVIGKANWSRVLNPRNIELRGHLDKATDQVIANARRGGASSDALSGAKQKRLSLLHLLLKAQEKSNEEINDDPVLAKHKPLTDIELRDEVKTFILAGHETTATWCYFAIYALCKFPDVQEKVYQEIQQYLGGNRTMEDLELDTIERMEYLDAFLSEVLRLYPPAGLFIRTNRYEEKIAGYTIPIGTRFVIPSHLLQRHPKYWKDPDTFQPERWIHKDPAAKEEFHDKIRFAYFPFSAGGRNCIGQRFATAEAKLIMAPLIYSFSFQLAPSQRYTEHAFSSFITMKLKPDLKIVATRRA